MEGYEPKYRRYHVKLEDFPTGTRFFAEGFDLPVAILPDGKAFSWYGGTATEWDDAHLRAIGVEPFGVLHELPYFLFAELVTRYEGGTIEDRKLLEAEVVAWVKEASDAAEAKAKRSAARTKPLSAEERASLDAKIDVLLARWEVAGEFSVFPARTRFFVKGADVPVAVLPDEKAASWYGGTRTDWDNDHLVFARSDSHEEFDEVPFAEFTRVVAESLGSTVDKQKLFEEEIAPLLAKLKADRELALKCPAVSRDDFMYCRPDKYGIWRDSDGDPI
jgi:hypothetical protein